MFARNNKFLAEMLFNEWVLFSRRRNLQCDQTARSLFGRLHQWNFAQRHTKYVKVGSKVFQVVKTLPKRWIFVKSDHTGRVRHQFLRDQLINKFCRKLDERFFFCFRNNWSWRCQSKNKTYQELIITSVTGLFVNIRPFATMKICPMA